MKTPDEINAANAEFWKAENERFRRLLEMYPHDLSEAAELTTKLAQAGLVNHPEFLSATSLNVAMRKAERKRQQDQSIRAKVPRKKKLPTARSVTIAAMRKTRKDGQTLGQFLASAEAGSVDGLEIKPANLRGVERFELEADELREGATVSRSTLEEWFTESGKPATLD